MAPLEPFLVFYGTSCQVINARGVRDAFVRFQEQRMFRFGRAEVRIRPLRKRDGDWIKDAGNARAIAAYEKRYGARA